MAGFLTDHDLYLSPTLAQPPLPLGVLDTQSDDLEGYITKLTGYMPHTQIANMTGQPAANLPLSWNAEGLPIGVQLIAPFGEEARLLRVAAQLEEAAPWCDKRPKKYPPGLSGG
jgi:Asp-tRNA(Asn)/Glu-tRNA(Gln) amidotransferase A subunit family amidase